MGCCGARNVEVKEKTKSKETNKEPEVIEPTKVETKKKGTKKEQTKVDSGDRQEEFTLDNMNVRKFLQQELDEHNRLRKLHGAEPLTLNSDLTEMAQKYAEVLAKKNTMQHSKDRKLKGHEGEWVGENLFSFSTSEPAAAYKTGAMSQSWYDEIKDYDFNTGKSKNKKAVGHFTQLVWKDTKEVGFGVGFNGGFCIGVANYYPGGNFNNGELQNVGKLGKN